MSRERRHIEVSSGTFVVSATALENRESACSLESRPGPGSMTCHFLSPQVARSLAAALIAAANHYDRETRRIELLREQAEQGAAA